MRQKKDCNTCWWELVRDEGHLRAWLADVLGAQFRYQWSIRDEMGREEPGMMHPDAYRRWLDKGPCADCPCSLRCNEICRLRARWWDARMEQVRKALGV